MVGKFGKREKEILVSKKKKRKKKKIVIISDTDFTNGRKL